jgi:hypothetical protein
MVIGIRAAQIQVKKNPGLPNGDPGFHCKKLRLG